jgi:hypothetical protein
MTQRTHDIESLAHRVANLERQNRRLKLVILALPVLALGLGAAAARAASTWLDLRLFKIAFVQLFEKLVVGHFGFNELFAVA